MPVRARTILDIAAVAILLAASVYLWRHYAALPEIIPAHVSGAKAHVEYRQNTWLPLAISAWAMVMLSLAQWILKDGTPMDDRYLRTPEQVERMRQVLSGLKVMLACGAALFIRHTVRQGLGGHYPSVAGWSAMIIWCAWFPGAALMAKDRQRRMLVG